MTSPIFLPRPMQNLLPRRLTINPIKEKSWGLISARDPFNAKKPMQTFEETMKADIAERPKVMKTQRDLLMRRYDLTPRLDREAKMSRGKPLPVGPTARLQGGLTWQKLASMTPEQIRSQNLFPYPALPHPKQATGGSGFSPDANRDVPSLATVRCRFRFA